MKIMDVMTSTEAAELWGLDSSTVKKACLAERFEDGEARKSSGTWLVTKTGMNKLYGESKEEKIMKTLEILKGKFLNKEIKLLDLDNKVLGLVSGAKSIFGYDVQEMLENSYCYQFDYESPSGYNFTFEIVEDIEDELDLVVKAIKIEVI